MGGGGGDSRGTGEGGSRHEGHQPQEEELAADCGRGFREGDIGNGCKMWEEELMAEASGGSEA